ncbi:MAG: hypothetical protein LBG60_13755 [Bifidobacteriaceae bacterium]|nr:hypothetical protein [Bifidobacteriaceae bacterium]
MNRLIHPVGPEPAAVYWRRRAGVLVGVLVVVIVLVMIIKALASGDSDKPPAPKSSPPASSPSASASADQAAAAACTAKDLTGAKLAPDGSDILLTKSQDSYAEGQTVIFSAKVKNTSDKDCSLHNNARNIVLHVVSNEDRIFDSADCAADTPADSGEVITIKADQTADIPIAWDPVRSQQGCPEIKEKPGRHSEATYVGTVKILDVPSDPTSFLLVP